MHRDLAINREQKKSSSFVKYSENYAEVLNRALKAKSTNVLDISHEPVNPFFIRVNSTGMGAYSTVYLVSEEKTRTIYAMKVISKSIVAKNKEQLQEEIKIHLRLRHENIIQLYHVYSEDGELRLILQYAEETLHKLLGRCGKQPEKQASQFMRQLLLALAYIHKLGITHRDIKLENILLLNGSVKLCDFGCARRKKQFDSNQLLGTIDYLSPEVAASKPYNHKTDIWAAGVVLHEMVFGRPLMGNMKQNEKYLYLMKFDYKNSQIPDCSSQLQDFLKKIFAPMDQRWEASMLLQHSFITNYPATV